MQTSCQPALSNQIIKPGNTYTTKQPIKTIVDSIVDNTINITKNNQNNSLAVGDLSKLSERFATMAVNMSNVAMQRNNGNSDSTAQFPNPMYYYAMANQQQAFNYPVPMLGSINQASVQMALNNAHAAFNQSSTADELSQLYNSYAGKVDLARQSAISRTNGQFNYSPVSLGNYQNYPVYPVYYNPDNSENGMRSTSPNSLASSGPNQSVSGYGNSIASSPGRKVKYHGQARNSITSTHSQSSYGGHFRSPGSISGSSQHLGRTADQYLNKDGSINYGLYGSKMNHKGNLSRNDLRKHSASSGEHDSSVLGSNSSNSVNGIENDQLELSLKNIDLPAIVPAKTKKPKPVKPVKKVIAINLPEHLQTIENVTHMCQQYGEILLVRVLKPGKVMPFDLKLYANKIADLGTTVCAIIEFEQASSAKLAVEKETENKLRLALLQAGADVALYGAPQGSTANSVNSSNNTHEESGIELVEGQSSSFPSGSSGASSKGDSLSHHSDEDEIDRLNDSDKKQLELTSSIRERNGPILGDSPHTLLSNSNLESIFKRKKHFREQEIENVPVITKAENESPLSYANTARQPWQVKESSTPYQALTLQEKYPNSKLQNLNRNKFLDKAVNSRDINRYLADDRKRLSMPVLQTARVMNGNWPVVGKNEENNLESYIEMEKEKESLCNKMSQETVVCVSSERRNSALNIAAAEFVPRTTGGLVKKESHTTSIVNGRVLTSLCVTLTPLKHKMAARSAIKLDLTNRRHPRIEDFESGKSNIPKFNGRHSPPLLSDPSDTLLLSNNFRGSIPRASTPVEALTVVPSMKESSKNDTSNTQIRNDDTCDCEGNESNKSQQKCITYSRDYLMSLRESKKALQLPNNLPNIPELLPTSKQMVIISTNSNASAHKAGNRFNHYKYNNNQHHNNHFNVAVPSYGTSIPVFAKK